MQATGLGVDLSTKTHLQVFGHSNVRKSPVIAQSSQRVGHGMFLCPVGSTIQPDVIRAKKLVNVAPNFAIERR